MGAVRESTGAFERTKASKVGGDSPSRGAFSELFNGLKASPINEDWEVWHEGKCGRCGRRLAVPESVETG
jgi:hypothetical protein